MPNKTQECLNLAQQTAKELTRYWENWTDYKALSNDRRLHWIHPHKMLALPGNVMAQPFHSSQVSIGFIRIGCKAL